MRQRLLAHCVGAGSEAGALAVALRIPNFLQNLLGEGALSASFIPVYVSLRAEGRDDEADRLAGGVFALLTLVVGVAVAGGLWLAPFIVRLLASRFAPEAFELAVRLTRIVFPGTGVLVLSAWCLGILNGHRRFFLAYAAPVGWNLTIIAALLWAEGGAASAAAEWAAWGTAAGSVVQLAVQWRSVMALLGRFRPWPAFKEASLRQVLRGFGPAVVARGVVQISAYVDVAYAALLSERAAALLNYAQTIALLPVSLFATAISASELVEMSSDSSKAGDGAAAAALSARVAAALDRMALFVVPSAVALCALGDLLSGALLESGRFSAVDSRSVWLLLVGAGLALYAQAAGRLYASAFYALKDTRTPLRVAMLRIAVGVAVGYGAVRVLPEVLGLPREVGAAFITLTTAATAWLELWLLRRALAARLDGAAARAPSRRGAWRAVAAALLAAGLTLLAKWALVLRFGVSPGVSDAWAGEVLPAPALPPLAASLALLGTFGLLYGGLALALRVPGARELVGRLARRTRV